MSIQSLIPESPNARGMLVFVIFLVVGSALFYIPELVSVTSSAKREVKRDAVSREQAARQLAERVKGRNAAGDPFDKVINKFDSGEYDKIPAAGVDAAVIPQLEDPEPKGFFARLFSLKPKNKGLKALRGDKGAQRKVLMQALRSGKPTWEILQLPVVITTIQRAAAESESLFKMIPPAKQDSRLAVRNFIAGLEYFQTREVQKLTPQEGLQFLRRIDREVTDALIKDDVGRDIFNVWRNVSLETLLVTSGAIDYRDALAPPFFADIVVTSVSIADEDQKRSNIIRRKLRWNLTVNGIVNSSAASQIQLVGPGHLLKSAVLPTTKDGKWRSFSFTTSGSPYGQFILRAMDEEGGFVEKFYHFIKYGMKYRDRQSGQYMIPQINIRERDRPVDRFLDRIFLVGEPRTGGPASARGDEPPSGDWTQAFDEGAPADSVPF